MSHTLACEAPDVFSAIASVTGTMSGFDWNNCNPSKSIPALRIHGVDDDVVPIDGIIGAWGGWGGAPHADEVISFWADLNGTTTIDSVFLAPSTNAFYHRNGQNGNEVWYYRIDNWGHRWPGSSSNTGTIASEVIYRIFQFKVPDLIKVKPPSTPPPPCRPGVGAQPINTILLNTILRVLSWGSEWGGAESGHEENHIIRARLDSGRVC